MDYCHCKEPHVVEFHNKKKGEYWTGCSICGLHIKENMPESWERDFESKFPAQDLYSCGDEELFDERNDGIIMFFRSLIAQERAKAVSEGIKTIREIVDDTVAADGFVGFKTEEWRACKVFAIMICQRIINTLEARSRGEIKNTEV